MSPQITVGEILIEEYLIPMGISQNAMARAIGVAPHAINEIVHGKRSINPPIPSASGLSSDSPMPSGTASRWSAISGCSPEVEVTDFPGGTKRSNCGPIDLDGFWILNSMEFSVSA